MGEFAPNPEKKEEHNARFLLDQYMAGDSHEHTVFSNPLTRHEADYTFEQVFNYVKEEINEGESKMQFIVFTEHPSDAGDPQLVDGSDLLEHQNKIHQFAKEQKEKGVEFPHIFSGVEANIIGSDGELDVPNEILSQLDLVVASGHSLKNAFPKENGVPDAEQLTNTYFQLMSNPDVDVIGHPHRCTSEKTLEKMDWEKLLSKAKETKTALEINVGASMPGWLIEKTILAGVPIFIGTDAHTLKQFQMLNNEEQALIENADDRLNLPLGVKFSFWKKVVRILKQLDQLVTPSEQVITSSYDRLNNWLSKEKSERKIEFQNGA